MMETKVCNRCKREINNGDNRLPNISKEHCSRLCWAWDVMPSLPELERLSGRMPVPIKAALKELVEENYIEWNPNTPPEMAIIIEGWERPDPRFKRVETATHEIQWGMDGSNTDYWTMY